jgi:hypothetical protein
MPSLAAKTSSPAFALPPGFQLVSLRESGDAFAHACRIAPESGAGTFVSVGRFDVLEFAVVLEPEEPLVSARRGFFAGMVAIADALASFAPPEKPITFTWPDTVHFDGGRLGGARLGWPEGCAEDEVPDFLVFGAMLLASPVGQRDTGLLPEVTFLEEEGFDPQEHNFIVESFARHILVAFDLWNERGFDAIAGNYLARLPAGAGETRRALDTNGDLLLHRNGALIRVALLGSLQDVSWLDRKTGLPWLVSR